MTGGGGGGWKETQTQNLIHLKTNKKKSISHMLKKKFQGIFRG